MANNEKKSNEKWGKLSLADYYLLRVRRRRCGRRYKIPEETDGWDAQGNQTYTTCIHATVVIMGILIFFGLIVYTQLYYSDRRVRRFDWDTNRDYIHRTVSIWPFTFIDRPMQITHFQKRCGYYYDTMQTYEWKDGLIHTKTKWVNYPSRLVIEWPNGCLNTNNSDPRIEKFYSNNKLSCMRQYDSNNKAIKKEYYEDGVLVDTRTKDFNNTNSIINLDNFNKDVHVYLEAY